VEVFGNSSEFIGCSLLPPHVSHLSSRRFA
jgi:hypothetical protein